MEATRHVLVDPHGLHPRRKGTSFPVFSSSGSANYSSNDGSRLLRSASPQLLFDGPGAGFLGPRPPPYSSSPTYSSLPPLHGQQPPLLPVPLSKSASLPSQSPPASTRRAVGSAAGRPVNKDSKAKKFHPAKSQKDSHFGDGQPRKDLAEATAPVDVPKAAAAAAVSSMCGMPEEDGDFAGYVYSLSPPPSSLPMPKFSLRVRISTEALGGGVLVGGGADAGASDDLRRLLRL